MIELKNFNILFVEDDLEIQTNMNRILNIIFNKVFIANNGIEALEVFGENIVHLIITDYEMPNMDGYEFSKNIREFNKSIPIVILSNYTDKDKLLKCIPLNLTSYLEKPIIYENLIKVLMICEKQINESSIFVYQLDNQTIYNFRTKELIQNKTSTKLTSLEIIVFEYLLDKKNQIVSKEELLHILNKDNYYDDISLKNIIYRLKKKFKNNSLILNQKNFGYMLKIQ
ncbi:response regulator transcription factor [Aliarcobacter vitoriensis]|uniref:DNA-binding response regulator n=1 Tax=Aliarcobacter vitoriensis TaxID=2011099 RepID=A0A366MU80_9BACT|nr:response regulator transcription factor [Aliarcobacter vitoriensis]RBQ29816.1 DNA-binding response regulator [Aliarcobacter vitoriensis]RBQ31303.1 DNA-binding response regulator [Arcobacter sp. FW59]